MSQSDAHIQDSQLLALTKFENNEKGHMRMAATLPSGRVVATEWFDPGKRREMGLKWIAALRAEIVADHEELRLRAMRQARLSTPPSPSGAHSAETKPQCETDTTLPSTSAGPSSGDTAPRTQAPIAAVDPLEFAQTQQARAEQDRLHWDRIAHDARQKADAAEAAEVSWQKIVVSLTQLELF